MHLFQIQICVSIQYNSEVQYPFLMLDWIPYELIEEISCVTQNLFHVGFKIGQMIHMAYRQVCCKEFLSFGWKITSLVSFNYAPFNLHCYGKPLDLDRAHNHWGHHNGVWQLLFSHLFGDKIKLPGKVNAQTYLIHLLKQLLRMTILQTWDTYLHE